VYVWRVPVLLFAPLVTTALLLAVAATLLAWRRSAAAPAVRGALLALVLIAHLAAPVVTSALLEPFLARERASGDFIHPSVLLLWSPALLVPLLLVLADRLFPHSETRAASLLKYRAAFFAAVLTFAFLNVTNWCSPGWCERFGFPLPYSWWSDAILIFDGRNMSAGNSVVAFLFNITALAPVVLAMSRTFRRGERSILRHE